MASHRRSDLTYGHLGQAIYDSNDKSWHFSRQPGRENVLRFLGRHETVIQGTEDFNGPSQDVKHGIKRLIRNHPELVPGVSLLPPLTPTSEAISRTVSNHDPAISSRVAVGQARDLDNKSSGSRTVPILAVVAGDAGNGIRLIQILERQLAWDDQPRSHGVYLRTPYINTGKDCQWTAGAGSVRQVCFAQAQGSGGSWLAVRQITATTILRPVYHRRPVAPPFSRTEHGLPSQLEANPLATISIDRTGGAPHADVAFNPWYHSQVGIVDQKGRWSVWNIEGRKGRRDTHDAKLECSGSIFESQQDSSTADHADGWGALSWVGNMFTLAVFNRHQMAVYDLRRRPATQLKATDLGLGKTPTWILDVKRSPVDDEHLFVLTTSHIFWSEVKGATDEGPAAQDQAEVKILLSWWHYRHPEDTSLQLDVSSVNEDISVVLSSRRTGLSTVYRFSSSSARTPVSTSISDPYRLDLPPGLNGIMESEKSTLGTSPADPRPSISGLLLLSAVYSAAPTTRPSGLGYMYERHDVQFCTLLVLGKDLNLSAALYTTGVPPGGWRGTLWGKNEPVREPNISRVVTRKMTVVDEPADEFVVPDGLIDFDAGDEELKRAAEVHEVEDAGFDPKQYRQQDRLWTLEWEWLYHATFQGQWKALPSPSGVDQPSEEQESSSGLVALSQKVAEKRVMGKWQIETLLELMRDAHPLPDIEKVSSDLANLKQFLDQSTEQRESSVDVSLRQLAWPHRNLASTEDPVDALQTMYKSIREAWITPIGDKAPDGFLSAYEDIAKSVAVEVHLASIGVQLVLPPNQRQRKSDNSADSLSTQNLTLTHLPIRQKKDVSTKNPPQPNSHSQPIILSSQPPPKPVTHNAAQIGAEDEEDDQDDPLSRLRAYTSIVDPEPSNRNRPSTRNPPAIANLLGKWTLGSNPANYRWEDSRSRGNLSQTTTTQATVRSGGGGRGFSSSQRQGSHRTQLPSSSAPFNSLQPSSARQQRRTMNGPSSSSQSQQRNHHHTSSSWRMSSQASKQSLSFSSQRVSLQPGSSQPSTMMMLPPPSPTHRTSTATKATPPEQQSQAGPHIQPSSQQMEGPSRFTTQEDRGEALPISSQLALAAGIGLSTSPPSQSQEQGGATQTQMQTDPLVGSSQLTTLMEDGGGGNPPRKKRRAGF